MHRLGRVSCKVLIFRGIKFATQISAAFAEPCQPAMMVTCFIWVPHHLSSGNVVLARFLAANVKRPSRKAIVDMCTRSGPLVFSRSQMCGIVILNKGREFVWRAGSEGIRASRIGLVAEVQA
jgi:hypothetical protein